MKLASCDSYYTKLNSLMSVFFSGNGRTEEKENKRFKVTWALEPRIHWKEFKALTNYSF